jgi:hypothetical protein
MLSEWSPPVLSTQVKPTEQLIKCLHIRDKTLSHNLIFSCIAEKLIVFITHKRNNPSTTTKRLDEGPTGQMEQNQLRF